MSESNEHERRVIKVPAPTVVDSGYDGDDGEGMVSPADIGSASRSCLAIIIILFLIALAICLFLLLQPFVN
jgi:hypothetical protein